jgi:hypothetical protein
MSKLNSFIEILAWGLEKKVARRGKHPSFSMEHRGKHNMPQRNKSGRAWTFLEQTKDTVDVKPFILDHRIDSHQRLKWLLRLGIQNF